MSKLTSMLYVISTFVFVLTVMHIDACKMSEFRCTASQLCIPFDKFCDSRIDCADGSDEPKACTGKLCLTDYFMYAKT